MPSPLPVAVPETITVDGKAAFDAMVGLLRTEALLDAVGGHRPVSGDYVCCEITETWELLFGDPFLAVDVETPLFAAARARADLEV